MATLIQGRTTAAVAATKTRGALSAIISPFFPATRLTNCGKADAPASSLLFSNVGVGTASSLNTNVPTFPSATGGGNRVFTLGSGIGTDSSMIAANNRWNGTHIVEQNNNYSRAFFSTAATRSIHNKPTNSKRKTLKLDHFSPQSHSVSPPSSRSHSSSSSSSHAGGVGGMNDEYGNLTSEGRTFVYPGEFVLESGEALPRAELRYMTYGELNEARDNVLVVCHALTGNASLDSWWGDLLGPGLAFDTSRYFVVCANILGSCYGSTGPASSIGGECEEYDSGEQQEKKGYDSTVGADREVYGMDFPDVSVRDTVRLQLHMLQDELNVSSVKCVIGGSFGGMQAVEYAAQGGSIKSPFAVDDEAGRAVPFVRSVVPIACGAAHTAWQIAISEVQRQAIYADPKWNSGDPSMDDPPLAGLSVARQIGMISYRTSRGYEEKFGRKLREEMDPPYGSRAPWEVKSYLEYQGYKFLTRFDPVTYVKLTEQMDTHDVGRGRGGREEALSSVRIPALVLGIDSDVLYPIHEQEELASLFPNGELRIIESDAGHDGFLLEQEQVAAYITDFLGAHD